MTFEKLSELRSIQFEHSEMHLQNKLKGPLLLSELNSKVVPGSAASAGGDALTFISAMVRWLAVGRCPAAPCKT